MNEVHVYVFNKQVHVVFGEKFAVASTFTARINVKFKVK